MAPWPWWHSGRQVCNAGGGGFGVDGVVGHWHEIRSVDVEGFGKHFVDGRWHQINNVDVECLCT